MQEYEGHEPATFEGLAPQVLVHHASFPCTKITKVPKFERNHYHPTNYWLVWGQFATQITQTREGLAPGIHIHILVNINISLQVLKSLKYILVLCTLCVQSKTSQFNHCSLILFQLSISSILNHTKFQFSPFQERKLLYNTYR